MAEEARQKKLERLQQLKTVLANKKAVAEDFKEKYNIDFDVLFDPRHEKFNETYALEDDMQENIVMGIKLKSASRTGAILTTFVGYHTVKFVLWRFGYFAKFFHRTRFLTFPLVGFGIYYNLKTTLSNLKEAGVLEYNQKRTRFDRDSKQVEKILRSRLDLAKEKQAGT